MTGGGALRTGNVFDAEEAREVNAITSRLPARLPSRMTHGRFARVSVLNAALLLLLVGAGVAAYLMVGQSKTSTSTPRTASVSRGVVLSTVSATGTLQAAKQLSVNFSASGELVSLNVNAGQRVRQGQLLGRIDATSARQAVLQAEASLKTARAQYQTTLTGETAQQRAQDALSVVQARQSLANASAALAATRKSIALDKRTSAASMSQAQRQLGVDQGQLRVDQAKLKTDSATYATVDAAAAAVAADKSQLAAAQATQQADQQSQLDAQAQQTRDNTQLTNDQASLKTAQTNNDTAGITRYTSAVSGDQSALSNDQSVLASLQKKLSNDGYAISQVQSQLSVDQSAQTALTSDQSAIRNDEQKIAQDNNSITNTKNNLAATKLKDAQSLQSARQQVASAKLGMKTTLAANAAKQAPATASALAAGQASVLQAQIGLANAQKTLSQTALRAPIAGVIASVSGTVGAQVSGSGTSAASTSAASSSAGSASSSSSSSNSAFVTLTGLTGMQVAAGFAETDAAKIQPGQAATVTVDALPSQQFAAHVLSVAGTATTSSSVVTYNVTFALDHASSQLKTGMTANVSVVTAEADNVLHVPTAAVRGSGSSTTVTVLRNGQEVSVPVVAGLQGDSSTAILSGLKATDTVVLPTVAISTSSGSGLTGSTSTTGGTSGGRIRGGGFGGIGGGFGG